ncbi:hypothetical protein K523DRAFT_323373 [Schizophyllum commune Tattone D]|nr:hypothetical protein K523DRAFT_323373 [Schizophyllum commune Tattone D]
MSFLGREAGLRGRHPVGKRAQEPALLTDPPFLNPLSIYNCNLRGRRECQVIQPDTVLKTSPSDSQCAWSSWYQLIHRAAFAAAHCDSRDLPRAEVS